VFFVPDYRPKNTSAREEGKPKASNLSNKDRCAGLIRSPAIHGAHLGVSLATVETVGSLCVSTVARINPAPREKKNADASPSRLRLAALGSFATS
jgi:hypothetical protein